MQQIEAEVLRAVADRNGASAAYVQSHKRAAVQKEAFALNQKKFEQGIISPIEYQTSSNNLLNAQAEKLNALLQFLIKKSVVAYYQGVSYIQQEF
jgi:outer membrane protein TolC